MKTEEIESRTALCARTFSPSAPIDNRDLFAGRIEQINKIIDAVNSKGQHAALYGERGVGKTSLANILKNIVAHQSIPIAKVNCTPADTFESVWHGILSEIQLVEKTLPFGLSRAEQEIRSSPSEHLR